VLVAATGPFLERWRARPAVRGALDAVNAAVVGLTAAVVVRLLPSAVAGWFEMSVLAAAGVLVWLWRLPGTAVLGMAGAAGLVGLGASSFDWH
jgi:chromate transport protein ChrA